MRVFLVTGFIGLVSGHGNIVEPPAWFHRCVDEILRFFEFFINQFVKAFIKGHNLLFLGLGNDFFHMK